MPQSREEWPKPRMGRSRYATAYSLTFLLSHGADTTHVPAYISQYVHQEEYLVALD